LSHGIRPAAFGEGIVETLQTSFFSSAIKALPPVRAARDGETTTPDGIRVADDTKATDVGARYAQALFDLAVERRLLDAVEIDLDTLAAIVRESQDLRRLIASPRFTAEDKAKGFAAVAARAQLGELTTKFLGLLAANRRASALLQIIVAFKRLAAARRGLVAAQVVTAVALTDAQTAALASALRQALGKEPQIEARVDPAILGGIKVRVGSRLYDASLKSKLDSLKYALKRA
jgi:F-type H+-transporting ATPase subunit delta